MFTASRKSNILDVTHAILGSLPTFAALGYHICAASNPTPLLLTLFYSMKGGGCRVRKQPAPILIWQNIWPACNLLLLLSLIHPQYTPFLVLFFEFKLHGIGTVLAGQWRGREVGNGTWREGVLSVTIGFPAVDGDHS
jgi:hypothetical protein